MHRFAWAPMLGCVVALPAQTAIDFARDVRPILSDRCFQCHGPDSGTRRAGLRLDRRDDALRVLQSGRAAIVAGDAANSELIRRLTTHDNDERMPPRDSKLVVSAAEVDVLRRWIDEGAEYAVHWAFEPLPATVPVPDVTDRDWIANPIDAFVLARLEREGLAPSPPATAAAYERRVSLSLTGLPPEAGKSSLDDLLASPRYGEQMASDWLDVARYADTFGYQNDVSRPVWPWRDWVVSAFNDNLPWDQFVTWQVAGDLLDEPTREQRLATAFQRLHRQTNEGGSVEEEMRLEYVADRTQTFATAFLGMTMECARCHDHKFDPLSTREYYELTSFFDNIDESGLYSHFTRATPTPALSLPNDAQTRQEAEAAARVRELETKCAEMLATPEPTAVEPPWTAKPTATFAFDGPESAGKIGDQPQFVPGKNGKAIQFDGENWAKFPKAADFDRHQPFSLVFWLRVPTRYDRAVVMHRSKSWTDAGSRGYELLIEDGELSFALVHFWPGNAIRIRADDELVADRWTHVALTYDGSSRAGGMNIYVDGKRAATRVVRDCLTRTIQGGGADALTLAQRFRDRGLKGGAIDDLQVFDRELTGYEVGELGPGESPSTQADYHAYCLHTSNESFRKLLGELREARLARGRIVDAQAEIMVMREMDGRRETFVRPRGSYLERGERVTPGTPSCLPPIESEGMPNRRDLARWLTHPDHPLTARVAVNRIWQMHFGTGLVATPEDFGSQGASPSHPRLLDWLARRFVSSGWDLKALHRLIVTSATFRQSSRLTPELLERDPENRLLARGPRYQLRAETLRDQALWAAGLLVDRRGGPPVKPYQPAGLWKEKSGATYRHSNGDGLYRRSLYTYWKRTSPPPTMMLLDASKRDVCVMQRQSTSSPLQALVLLNDPQFVEAARVFAEQLVAMDGSDGERLRHLFHRLTNREPTENERSVLERALAEQREVFAADVERARQLLAVGERKAADLPVAEVAAWTMVVSVLMNFDEVVRQR